MALVSRDRARAILEDLIGNLGHLERVASISDIYINPNFDSELESRFIEGLSRLSGKHGLPFVTLVQDIVHGKSGYLLEVDQQRYWIEPQVNLGPSEGVSVACRPDFVFWPAQSRSARRPIAVFCDGWAYHQTTAREDALKRSALVASGRFWVFSVTWDDVHSALNEEVDTTLVDALDAMCFNSVDSLSEPLRVMIESRLWTEHAISVLIQWLSKPAEENVDPTAMKVARHAGATALRMVPHPTDVALEAARVKLNQFWTTITNLACERPSQSVASGNVNDSCVAIRYWWPREMADSTSPLPVSPGFVIYDEAQTQDEITRHLSWRRWLWLFNVFQTLPGVLLSTQTGLEGNDHTGLTIVASVRPATAAQEAAQGAAWADVLNQTVTVLKEPLTLLSNAGLPPPDEVGFELEDGGEVVAEAELAWTANKLALLMTVQLSYQQVWEAAGWNTVVAEGDWPEQLIQALGSHVS